MNLMASFVFIAIIMATFVKEIKTHQVDCSLTDVSSSMTQCAVTGTADYYDNNYIYCAHPYTCCEEGNGCCFDGNSTAIYTEPELVALVLNGTAICVVGILSLVICGATFCNDKEDESHIFLKK